MRGGGGEGEREAEHLVSVSLASLLQLVGEEGGGEGESVLHRQLQGAVEHRGKTSDLVVQLDHQCSWTNGRCPQIEGNLNHEHLTRGCRIETHPPQFFRQLPTCRPLARLFAARPRKELAGLPQVSLALTSTALCQLPGREHLIFNHKSLFFIAKIDQTTRGSAASLSQADTVRERAASFSRFSMERRRGYHSPTRTGGWCTTSSFTRLDLGST